MTTTGSVVAETATTTTPQSTNTPVNIIKNRKRGRTTEDDAIRFTLDVLEACGKKKFVLFARALRQFRDCPKTAEDGHTLRQTMRSVLVDHPHLYSKLLTFLPSEYRH